MNQFPVVRPLICMVIALAGFTSLGGCKERQESHEAARKDAGLPAAAEWRLKDLAGAEVKLSQFKGKVVIVDFWATWCPPCRAEMPFYVDLYKKLAKRGLVIVGISLDAQGPGVVRKFVESMGINYPIVMGDDEVTSAYQVEVMPTTFVIDRDGRVRYRKIGAVSDEAAFEKLIESYL